MSENITVGNYTVQSTSANNYLKEGKINETQLAQIDKNGDMIISEDEFVEFQDGGEGTQNSSASSAGGISEEDVLKTEYQVALQNANFENKRLMDLSKDKKDINDEIEKLDKSSENYEKQLKKLQSKLSKKEAEIKTTNTTISQYQSEMDSLAARMSSIQGGSSSAGTSSSSGSSNAAITETIPEDLAQRLDSKLGEGFAAKCEQVAANLNCNPNDLLAMMYSESGIDPHCVGYNGAVGLGMFMPSILSAKGYDPSQVAAMSGVEQLDIMQEYLSESKTTLAGLSESDRLDAGTLYAMNFLPAVANKEVLCTTSDSLSWAYSANSPLDIDGNGDISKSDLAQRLKSKYEEMYKYF